MAKRVRVDLFFDVISPYSWIAFEGLTRYAKAWPIDLRLRPFYFPGVLKASGNMGPPMLDPVKEQYLYKDLPRSAKHWGIDFKLPPNYKNMVMTKSSVLAQRVILGVQESEKEKGEEVARALWRRLYTEGKGIFEEGDMREVLSSVGVSSIPTILDLARSPAIKERMRENTDEALANGCFGAPWVHVHPSPSSPPEVFFGSDRIAHIADLIGQEYSGPIHN